MPATTLDYKGRTVAPGDQVRILAITPDYSLDEDDLDLFMDMVGSTCEVDYIDQDGAAWVAVWWNCSEGSLATQVGLMPQQMEKT